MNEGVIDYANELKEKMIALGIRADIDTSDDSFNKKIRKAVTKKNPNIWIIGDNEKADRSITWRRYAVQEQFTVSADTAIEKVLRLRRERIMDNFSDVEV